MALKSLLPESIKKILRPSWYKTRTYFDFLKQGGRFSHDSELGARVASRMFNHQKLPVIIRSEREFRRWANFGKQSNDVVHEWLTNLSDCQAFWDIGSANGLEGFYVNHMHDCPVVFVEPFTPSIETILKTVYHQQKNMPQKQNKFHVLQALIDRRSGFQRMDMHEKPVAGDTFNSAEQGKGEYCHGGRTDIPVSVSQWLASVSLDDMKDNKNLPTPTHVKIDVDGFELRALAGGEKLLKSQIVKEWCIEVNDDHGPEIIDIMDKAGYRKVTEYIHPKHRDQTFTADYLFVLK